jgi:hypothetical protein
MITVLLLAGVIGWLGGSRGFWVLAWPGTVVHELMHWVVGLVTLGSPENLRVFPEPAGEDGQVLGSVEFNNVGWWNALPIGIAPLLAFPLALMAADRMTFAWTWQSALIIWILASIVSQCWPSPADWRIAFSRKMGVLFWIAVTYWIFTK